MSLHHGPSLVAAAVRAAILAKAPRRTVAAVAAAMASALHKPVAQPPPPSYREQTGAQSTTAAPPPGALLEVFTEAVRKALAEQRRKKKDRRRAKCSNREGAGRDVGQPLTTVAPRRHDEVTADGTPCPGGGGAEAPSAGTCAQRPPKLHRTANEDGHCLPAVPVFPPEGRRLRQHQNMFRMTVQFTRQAQVSTVHGRTTWHRQMKLDRMSLHTARRQQCLCTGGAPLPNLEVAKDHLAYQESERRQDDGRCE